MNNDEIAQVVIHALEEVKGQNIERLDVRKLTQITDYMIIVTGTSTTHIKSLADEVVHEVRQTGGRVVSVEGRLQAEWVLVDLGGVVVHIMLASARKLYNLEDLWNFDIDEGSTGTAGMSAASANAGADADPSADSQAEDFAVSGRAKSAP